MLSNFVDVKKKKKKKLMKKLFQKKKKKIESEKVIDKFCLNFAQNSI